MHAGRPACVREHKEDGGQVQRSSARLLHGEFFRDFQGLPQAAAYRYNPASYDIGVWRSPVAHLVRDEGVAGSNPATPTIGNTRIYPGITH